MARIRQIILASKIARGDDTLPLIMEGVTRAAFAFITLLVLTRLLGGLKGSQLTFF